MVLLEKLARSPAVKTLCPADRALPPGRQHRDSYPVVCGQLFLQPSLLFNGLVIDQNVLEMFVVTFWPLLIIRLAVFQYYGLFSGMWRFVSFEDLIIIIRAVIISSLLVYGISFLWDRIRIGEQVYLLDMTFCVIICGGIRFWSAITGKFTCPRTAPAAAPESSSLAR